MRPPSVCLAHTFQRRSPLGTADGYSLYFCWRVSVVPSGGRLSVAHARASDLSFCRRSLGTDPVVRAPPYARQGLAVIRWNHHADTWRHDLEDVAIEYRMGHWHACGDQHV